MLAPYRFLFLFPSRLQLVPAPGFSSTAQCKKKKPCYTFTFALLPNVRKIILIKTHISYPRAGQMDLPYCTNAACRGFRWIPLHCMWVSLSNSRACNKLGFPIPDRARPCSVSVSVSVSVSSSLELHGEQGSMWTRLHWTATLTSKAWTLQPRMWRTCCPPSHLMVRTVRTS